MTQRGRPKTFDRDHALEAAMMLFWNRGFEQTSVDELAAAMGIQTSSLYSSFGDKESLYLEAVDHYLRGRGRIYETAISEGKTAKEGFANLLKVAASEMTRRDQPKGSMLSLALPTCSPKYEKLQEEVNRLRDFSETVWMERLRGAVRNKELPKSTDLQVLQLFFRNTLFGMSLLARAGESRDTLTEIGKLALRVWPSSERASTS
jgi:AcrR family transcriptional regulator